MMSANPAPSKPACLGLLAGMLLLGFVGTLVVMSPSSLLAGLGEAGSKSLRRLTFGEATQPNVEAKRVKDGPILNFMGSDAVECFTEGDEGVGSGHACVFPFKYGNVVFNHCTTAGHHTDWCYTDTDANGEGSAWGNCGVPGCDYEDFVDVTKFVETETFKATDFRCCCDKHKGWKDTFRNGLGWVKERAGWCIVSEVDNCWDVKPSENTYNAHEYDSTDGKCEILPSDAQNFFESRGLSPRADYCEAGTTWLDFGSYSRQLVVLSAAGLGDTVSYECPEGTEHEGADTVECKWGSAIAGKHSDVKCKQIADWCPAYSSSVNDHGRPRTMASNVGDSVDVHCPPDLKPESATVQCDVSHTLTPMPMCVKP